MRAKALPLALSEPILEMYDLGTCELTPAEEQEIRFALNLDYEYEIRSVKLVVTVKRACGEAG